MTSGDYIAILSIAITTIISIIGGVYAVATNTKKFELAEAYKKELLEWYSHTVRILTSIISKAQKGNYDYEDELALLSAQVEIGRFYFPNVDKQDNYGKDKPSAYQGYRNIVLEFLMFFYDTAKRDDVKVHVHALWSFMRLYTSAVFDIVSPRDRIKMVKKYSDFTMDGNISLNEFLEDENNFKKFNR